MKHLKFENGGRPLVNDDLATLQSETLTALEGQYAGLGAFILSGCAVTVNGAGGHNIAAGLVFIDGKIKRFDGVTGVTLPVDLISAAAVESDARTYEDATTKNCMVEYKATSRASVVDGLEKVKVENLAPLTYYDVFRVRAGIGKKGPKITPVLNAGFTASLPGAEPFYFMDALGAVHFGGYASTPAAGGVIFSIAAEYRPDRLVFINAGVSSNENTPGSININPSTGEVNVSAINGSGDPGTTGVTLEGLFFHPTV